LFWKNKVGREGRCDKEILDTEGDGLLVGVVVVGVVGVVVGYQTKEFFQGRKRKGE
jgi:hypothetical protein